MTIPASRFHDNKDGTAWLIVSANEAQDAYRRCDECGGWGGSGRVDCPPCHGTGRHCFDLDVECDECGPTGLVRIGDWSDQSPRTRACTACSFQTEGHRTVTRSVYVLNILAIESASKHGDYEEGHCYFDHPDGIAWIEGEADDINLPDDAAVGDTAVHLKVATP